MLWNLGRRSRYIVAQSLPSAVICSLSLYSGLGAYFVHLSEKTHRLNFDQQRWTDFRFSMMRVPRKLSRHHILSR